MKTLYLIFSQEAYCELGGLLHATCDFKEMDTYFKETKEAFIVYAVKNGKIWELHPLASPSMPPAWNETEFLGRYKSGKASRHNPGS